MRRLCGALRHTFSLPAPLRSSLSIAPTPLCIASGCLTSASAVLLQRGYRGGRGGGGGFQNQQGGGRGFGRGGPPNRNDGFGARGNGGRGSGGFQNRNENFGGRGGGARGGSRGGSRGRGGGGPAHDYLQENAQNLVSLKQQFKNSKLSGRERRDVQREARRLVRRTQVDPSTQDEKSVMTLVNCAATFHCRPSEGVENGIKWLLHRIRSLTPQNVALLANAIGSVEPEGAENMLKNDVTAALEAGALEGMTPVEVIMVLQAFQRVEVESNEALQDKMLMKLLPAIPSMPIPHLSTLSVVVAHHSMKTRDVESWKRLADAVGSRITKEDVGQIHSKEAITLLTSAPHLMVQPEVIELLMDRCTNTSGFHTDDQVGQLLRALHSIRTELKDGVPERLEAAEQRLKAALITRLERVAEFASPTSIASIWLHAAESGVEIPEAIQLKLLEQMELQLPFGRLFFRQMGKVASGAAQYKLPSTNFLHTLARMVLGQRPPRLDRKGKPIPLNDESSQQILSPQEMLAARRDLFARRLGQLVQLRIELEKALSKSEDMSPDEALQRTIPKILVDSVKEAPPQQIVLAARFIGECESTEKCKRCNTPNNEAVLKAIEERLKRAGPGFLAEVSPMAKQKLKERAEILPSLNFFVPYLK